MIDSNTFSVIGKDKTANNYYKSVFHFCRSCFDETKLCNGLQLCNDDIDLKWCKKATSWSLPEAKFLPLRGRAQVKCTLDENDQDPQGQWIEKVQNQDGLAFHCLNRVDENPFAKTTNQPNEDDKGKAKKTWLEEVNEPCNYSGERRCLGNRAHQCVCKFFSTM